MKILFWTIAGFAVLGLILFTCSRQASPHSNERTAIYNLSATVHGFAKQLDRIESLVIICNSNNHNHEER